MKAPFPRFRSVRQKLFAGVLLTSVAALLVTGVTLFFYDLRSYRETSTAELAVQAELIGHASTAALQFDDAKFAADNLARLRGRPSIRAAAIYNSRGAVFASYVRPGARPEDIPVLPSADGVLVYGDHMAVFHRIVANNEIPGTVYLEADFDVYRRIANYAAILVIVSVAALLVSLLLSRWLQAGVTRPIIEISHLARQVVDTRDYSLRARRTTEDEIGTLVDAFNDMLSEIEKRTTALETTTREVGRLNEDLENRVRSRTKQLEETNRQLEAFSYSVSHDLRAPLRAIDGFGQALLEDYGEKIEEGMRRYIERIRAATQRMGQLIDDLLSLAQITRAEVTWKEVDLSAMCRQVFAELAQRDPGRRVETVVWDDVVARGDPRLVRIALENLLGNAWKFTSKAEHARIEFGVLRDGASTTFFVRDSGAGFDMVHADKLFNAFQRLHAVREYPGTGIGLATVQRIVHKLGGRLWAYAELGKGATFYFTLGGEGEAARPASERQSA